MTPPDPPSHARFEILLPVEPAKPQPILTTESTVAQWPTTPGFQAFWGWIKRRCERIKGKDILSGDYNGTSEVGTILYGRAGIRLRILLMIVRQDLAEIAERHASLDRGGPARAAERAEVRKSGI
jgi:hypothetical protein